MLVDSYTRLSPEAEKAKSEYLEYASKLGIKPTVAFKASDVIETVKRAGRFRPSKRKVIRTGAFHLVAIDLEEKVTVEDISRVSRTSQQEIIDGYKFLRGELEIEVGPDDPAKNAQSLAKEAGLEPDDVNRALRILVRAKETGNLEAGKPKLNAVASLHAAGIQAHGQGSVPKALAELTGYSEKRIIERANKMLKSIV
jgi:transcription initiation factor TFIIIB Brf1 subunit/transcription initiation factor TFIIB